MEMAGQNQNGTQHSAAEASDVFGSGPRGPIAAERRGLCSALGHAHSTTQFSYVLSLMLSAFASAANPDD
jgi:hypothetical protein